MCNSEYKLPILTLDHLDLIHRVDNEVGTQILYLFPSVRSADGNDGGAGSDGRLDARRRVFEDHRSCGIDPEVGRSQEKGVGEGLSA